MNGMEMELKNKINFGATKGQIVERAESASITFFLSDLKETIKCHDDAKRKRNNRKRDEIFRQ